MGTIPIHDGNGNGNNCNGSGKIGIMESSGGVHTVCTGREQLIRSHSLARFCFELSGNSN